ncbi:MAG: oleate hydratase, partial [Vitreoscilla sp.]|nr:oleate hydratase [Vitreoscilla sp.]
MDVARKRFSSLPPYFVSGCCAAVLSFVRAGPPLSAAVRRVAVVGSGVAGLAAAWHLAHDTAGTSVTLFEADARFGGHAHTVELTLNGQAFGVDTGFLVYNERTYPKLIRLFERLGVATAASD